MKNEVFSYNGNPVTFQIGSATMVNATEMAKPFGENKSPRFWIRLPTTQEFLSTLSDVRKLHITQLVTTAKGNSSLFEQGTWMHEDVALEFARWLSPQFAIWCNDRIKATYRWTVIAAIAAIIGALIQAYQVWLQPHIQ